MKEIILIGYCFHFIPCIEYSLVTACMDHLYLKSSCSLAFQHENNTIARKKQEGL